MTNAKRDVTVDLGSLSNEDYYQSTLASVKEAIEDIERKAKEQGFDVAHACLDGELKFFAHRKETDEEFAARCAVSEKYKKEEREYKYKEYLKLKAIFEPNVVK